MRTPTTVFSGFLGSGKTTVISHLIDALQANGEQVVYIKNEIGDADLDAQLMRGKNIQTKELLNGCICCTLVGPFHIAINEVIEAFHPDRIIIEASGAADPAALALMVSAHPLLTRDSAISIVDVVNFEGYKDLSLTAQNQTIFTDLIIFNKIELASLERKQSVVGYVRELNTHSPIIEAPGAMLNPEVVFGVHDQTLSEMLTHTSHKHQDHVISDHITAVSYKPEKTIEQKQLKHWLEDLPSRVFRAKGVVRDETGEYVLFNKVGKRSDIQIISNTSDIEPLIILIGHNLTDEQKLFDSLKNQPQT